MKVWLLLLTLAPTFPTRCFEEREQVRQTRIYTDPMEVTKEMRSFLEQHVPDTDNLVDRYNAFVTALFTSSGLGFRYQPMGIKTAPQAFKERSGNCVAVALLVAGLARELGFQSYFQEVVKPSRQAAVSIAELHVNVVVIVGNRLVEVDLIPESEREGLTRLRLSDEHLFSHYFNSLGAKRMLDGDWLEAKDLFERAVDFNPTFSSAWSNLGIAYRYEGKLRMAEFAYYQAVKLDPKNRQSWENLAMLYFIQGHMEEAEKAYANLVKHRSGNPYRLYRLANDAFHSGHTKKGEAYLARVKEILPQLVGKNQP